MSECSHCDGTGWRPVEKNGLRAVEICSCRRHHQDEQWWLQQAQIPRAFWNKDLADFSVKHGKDAAANENLKHPRIFAERFVKDYPSVEKGILFLGPPGVGKTHLTVAILKELMQRKGVECLFCSYQELLRRIRDSYNPISRSTESEVVQPVLETEVVAIDDLGAERISDWVEDTVTYLLNYRYTQNKITLLTSNLPDTPEEVKERSPSGKYAVGDTLEHRIGIRVRSRLYEMCKTVRISADDFRQSVRQHGG